MLRGFKTDYLQLGNIQEFGAAAYVKDPKAGKLDARAKVGRFVGYDMESKGFRIDESVSVLSIIPKTMTNNPNKTRICLTPYLLLRYLIRHLNVRMKAVKVRIQRKIQRNMEKATVREDLDDFDIEENPPTFRNDLAFVATHPSDPKTLDEGLRGPNAKKWEEALQDRRQYRVVKL